VDALLKQLAIYGPLGIWAAVASWYAFTKDKEHHATRDAHEKAFAAQALQFAGVVKAQADGYTERIQEVEDRCAEQMSELTDRLIGTAESYAEKNRQLTEKVAVLVDALTRSKG
jgi:hypothetical protein